MPKITVITRKVRISPQSLCPHAPSRMAEVVCHKCGLAWKETCLLLTPVKCLAGSFQCCTWVAGLSMTLAAGGVRYEGPPKP